MTFNRFEGMEAANVVDWKLSCLGKGDLSPALPQLGSVTELRCDCSF
jgi:hypothetical protein